MMMVVVDGGRGKSKDGWGRCAGVQVAGGLDPRLGRHLRTSLVSLRLGESLLGGATTRQDVARLGNRQGKNDASRRFRC